MSVAKDIINQIVSQGAGPIAKAAGFKKSALTFTRRRGEVVQVVNFQLSQGNFADTGSYYTNVGIAFDALWRLAREPVAEHPREYQCHFRRRIEQLIPKEPQSQKVTSATDIAAAVKGQASTFSKLLDLIDSIDSPGAMLEKKWLRIGGEIELRACLLYVLGRYEEAAKDIQRVSKFFSDRQGMSVANLIKRLKLTKLSPLV
jgi:hypothetical protein